MTSYFTVQENSNSIELNTQSEPFQIRFRCPNYMAKATVNFSVAVSILINFLLFHILFDFTHILRGEKERFDSYCWFLVMIIEVNDHVHE